MPDGRLLLIVEDEPTFARTLARSFERRGYRVIAASDPDEMQAVLERHAPTHAVIDLKLGGASGLTCVEALHARHPDARIVVLTGYASIATAVEAIKLGACHYLAKPSNTDDIEAAFEKVDGDTRAPVAEQPSTFKTHEWELIHRTLADANFNISETARRLGMHRRTLARKLDKRRRD
jgi:two-component system response regulator RegA